MSLLNDALRKKDRELVQPQKHGVLYGKPSSGEIRKIKVYGIGILVIFAVFSLGVLGWMLTHHTNPESEQLLSTSDLATDNGLDRSKLDSSSSTRTDQELTTEKEVKREFLVVGSINEIQKERDKGSSPKEAASRENHTKTIVPSKKKGSKERQKLAKEEKKTSEDKQRNDHVYRSEELFYRKALSYHRSNDLERAIQLYHEVLRKNPEHFNALLNLASAYIKTSAYSEAYPLLEKARRRDPKHPQALLNLAIAEIGLGQLNSAISHLNEASNLEGVSKFELNFHRGVAFSHLKRFEGALKWYKMAEQVHPTHPLLVFNMAVIYDKLERYHEALRYYGEFLTLRGSSTPEEKREVEARIGVLRAYMARQSGSS